LDADLALNPAALADYPPLDTLLRQAGFAPNAASEQIGTWIGPEGIPVDLLVPEALGGPGRRAARLAAHGNRIARKGARSRGGPGRYRGDDHRGARRRGQASFRGRGRRTF